jgi:hypothetical protein
MFEIPLLDDEYREAFLYLLDQIDLIKSYSDNNKPWDPKDEERLGEAFVLFTAVPEEYLPDIVENLQILNGLKEIHRYH